MANQLYGYNPSYGAAAANLASAYPSRSVTDTFLPDSSLLSSSRYLSSSDPSYYSLTDRHSSLLDSLRFSSASDIGGASAALSSRIPGLDAAAAASASVDALAAAGLKRSSEGLIFVFFFSISYGPSNSLFHRLTTQSFSFWKLQFI